jgi:hypothetical protein
MALFSGFNQLRNNLNSATASFGNISSQVNSLTSQASAAFNQFDGAVNQARGALNSAINSSGIGQAFNTVNRISSVAQEFQSIGSMFSSGFGTRTRMAANALQGLRLGAEPIAPSTATAILADNSITSGGIDANSNDWRVSLSVPTIVSSSPLLAPFRTTGNKLVFPFNPTILFGNTANYNSISPIHSNYPYYAYENSQVDSITIAGEYFSQNEDDARYWIAVLHYLRTMTKMFYGGGNYAGTPPLLTRLNGYGKHVLNNIPCVINTFSVDLPSDVDYIRVEVDGQQDYVPTRAQVNVTLHPQYSRVTQSKFDLEKFANGYYAKNDPDNTGFI